MEALAQALLYRPRPRMSLSLRTMYVLMKNPAPTPVEFARLFAEISLIDRPTDAGTITLAACKKANRQHYPTFIFDSLTEVEQRQYRAACFDKACPICGDGVKAEDTFCSPQCEAVSCSRCQGRLETHELEREVYNVDREIKMRNLGSLLQAKGVTEPLPYLAQLEWYCKECRGKVACCAACEDCQELHFAWLQQHTDFKVFGKEPPSFWDAQEYKLEQLRQLPATKTLVSKETRCSQCGSEESGRPALQRRRLVT
jgi:hypothetical protein